VLVFDAAPRSWIGPREDNQDSAVATPRLIALADGVGGHAGGALASAVVLGHVLASVLTDRWDELREDPRLLLGGAGAELLRMARLDGRLATMSSTLVAAVLHSSTVALLSVGDSRGYLLRNGVLTQLTRDHTLTQMLLDAGTITAAEAEVHPHRSRLYASVSASADPPSADVVGVDVAAGDRLLLCSDGLSDTVPSSVLAGILAASTSPDEAAAALLQAAVGATDNVTVLVADVRNSPAEPPPYIRTAGAIAQLQISGQDGSRSSPSPVPRGWERAAPG
jgi:serine/threonine protein phosphatase PrpC